MVDNLYVSVIGVLRCGAGEETEATEEAQGG